MQNITSNPAECQPDGDLCGSHVADPVAEMGLLAWCPERSTKGYVRGKTLNSAILQPYIHSSVIAKWEEM